MRSYCRILKLLALYSVLSGRLSFPLRCSFFFSFLFFSFVLFSSPLYFYLLLSFVLLLFSSLLFSSLLFFFVFFSSMLFSYLLMVLKTSIPSLCLSPGSDEFGTALTDFLAATWGRLGSGVGLSLPDVPAITCCLSSRSFSLRAISLHSRNRIKSSRETIKKTSYVQENVEMKQ